MEPFRLQFPGAVAARGAAGGPGVCVRRRAPVGAGAEGERCLLLTADGDEPDVPGCSLEWLRARAVGAEVWTEATLRWRVPIVGNDRGSRRRLAGIAGGVLDGGGGRVRGAGVGRVVLTLSMLV
jgi:hypothetical protein